MSGGGGDGRTSTRTDSTYTDYNAFQSYLSSQEGQKWQNASKDFGRLPDGSYDMFDVTDAQGNKTVNVRKAGGTVDENGQTPFWDISQIMQEYIKYKAATDQNNSMWNTYSNMMKEAPSRDETILAAGKKPLGTPNSPTILGSTGQ